MHLFSSFCQVGLGWSTWSKFSSHERSDSNHVAISQANVPNRQTHSDTNQTKLEFGCTPLEEQWRRFEKDECRGTGKRSPELIVKNRVLQCKLRVKEGGPRALVPLSLRLFPERIFVLRDCISTTGYLRRSMLRHSILHWVVRCFAVCWDSTKKTRRAHATVL